ncbi:MAG TPA: hypothetical protein VE954_34090 [Oligoflexus sp.]|uniref:hypothetical protein n=1 Tax=Oligoflexus sp. TaxID=1971216 RepID=UPI002D2CB8BE|nr:hypothetical protein [Oligoflexus sp.]HYX38159.1 hypothetical protein [Oligoflexus sp.]
MRRILQAVHIATLLLTAAPGFAQDVETEEMICRDIGDIFCLLEEFSKNLEGSTSLSAKPTPAAKAPVDRTVVELQRDRRESKLTLSGSSQPTEVTLINLSPEVNVWYLLKLQWSPQKIEWYHLDNVDPSGLWLELNQQEPNGLWLRNGKGGDRLCELWSKDSGHPLRAARAANAPYAPLCQNALYLRNRIDGYRTTKEWVVEFLRANIWGGETITNIVKETVYKDSFLLKSNPVGTTGSAETNELPNGPALARVAAKMKGEMLPVKELGISVMGATDENLEVGRWYRTTRQDGVFVSVMEPKAVDEDIMKSHRDYVRDLDAVEMEAISILVAFDTTVFDLSFAMGTDHPAVGWSERVLPDVRNPLSKGPDGFDNLNPLTSTGLIPPYLSDRVAGIFTGGFKRDHGSFRWGDLARKNQGSHYGFMENGTILSSIVPDLATLIVYKDGRVDMKTWNDQDALNIGSMKHVRQNGVPIIDWNDLTQQAVPGRWVSNWTLGNWSGSQDKKFRSLRAGVCEAENKGRRFVIYGYFSSMTPAGMARVFQSYGCTYAMHLDMNALEHTYMSLYSTNKSKEPAPQHLVKGMKVLDERFKGNVPRYIGYPDNRDFFYFTEKKK